MKKEAIKQEAEKFAEETTGLKCDFDRYEEEHYQLGKVILYDSIVKSYNKCAEYLLPEIEKRDEVIREMKTLLSGIDNETPDLPVIYPAKIRELIAKAETILKG